MQEFLKANDLLSILKDHGVVTCKIGDISLQLQLKNHHERIYAASFIANARSPQHDIDVFLCEALIKKGDVVVDGGANIGVTAAFFKENGAAHVYCYEPEPALFERLSLIADETIDVYPFALAEKAEVRQLYVSELHNQGSAIVESTVSKFPKVFGESPRTIAVNTVSINEHLAGKQINVLKLDVEGAEMEALKGASSVLKSETLRVVILESYEDIQNIENILGGLFQFNYRALIAKTTYQLELIPLHIFFDESEFEQTSPMFVFSKTPLTSNDAAIDETR